MKKYELLLDKSIEFMGKKLFRIRALVDIEKFDVKAGDEGGYIEAEKNLDQSSDAWVSGNARVFGNAEVSGDARVFGNARVSGNAEVFGNARVFGNAEVSGNARVFGNARVSGAYQIMTISNMGTVQRTTTFFSCKDGKIRVSCGCFFGDLDQFREQVRVTRGGTKHEKAYLAAADLAESVLDTTIPEE